MNIYHNLENSKFYKTKYDNATYEEKIKLVENEPEKYLIHCDEQYEIVRKDPQKYLRYQLEINQVAYLEEQGFDSKAQLLKFLSNDAQKRFIEKNKVFLQFAVDNVQSEIIQKNPGVICLAIRSVQEKYLTDHLKEIQRNNDETPLVMASEDVVKQCMQKFNDQIQKNACARENSYFKYASPHVQKALFSKNPEIYLKFLTPDDQKIYCEKNVESLKYAEPEVQKGLCVNNKEMYLKHASPEVQEELCKGEPEIYFSHATIGTQDKLLRENKGVYLKYVADKKVINKYRHNQKIAKILNRGDGTISGLGRIDQAELCFLDIKKYFHEISQEGRRFFLGMLCDNYNVDTVGCSSDQRNNILNIIKDDDKILTQVLLYGMELKKADIFNKLVSDVIEKNSMQTIFKIMEQEPKLSATLKEALIKNAQATYRDSNKMAEFEKTIDNMKPDMLMNHYNKFSSSYSLTSFINSVRLKFCSQEEKAEKQKVMAQEFKERFKKRISDKPLKDSASILAILKTKAEQENQPQDDPSNRPKP